MRKWLAIALLVLSIPACSAREQASALGGIDAPAPAPAQAVSYYRLTGAAYARITQNALTLINQLRAENALLPIFYNEILNTAAVVHASDIMAQSRAWNFGTDGSSPIDRARRFDYQRLVLGEAVSETFENESDTVAAWAEDPAIRALILSSDATEMGFGYTQEESGKIWWVLLIGGEGAQQPISRIPAFESLKKQLAIDAAEGLLAERQSALEGAQEQNTAAPQEQIQENSDAQENSEAPPDEAPPEPQN